MSIPDRLFQLGKAYANNAKERIEDALAERELDAHTGGASAESDTDALMRRAREKIEASRSQALSKGHVEASVVPVVAPSGVASASEWTSQERLAFQTLGIAVTHDLSLVQSTYETLVRRADARRFPDGSAEQKAVESILERVNVAYDVIRRKLDPTENRFSKLEF